MNSVPESPGLTSHCKSDRNQLRGLRVSFTLGAMILFQRFL